MITKRDTTVTRATITTRSREEAPTTALSTSSTHSTPKPVVPSRRCRRPSSLSKTKSATQKSGCPNRSPTLSRSPFASKRSKTSILANSTLNNKNGAIPLDSSIRTASVLLATMCLDSLSAYATMKRRWSLTTSNWRLSWERPLPSIAEPCLLASYLNFSELLLLKLIMEQSHEHLYKSNSTQLFFNTLQLSWLATSTLVRHAFFPAISRTNCLKRSAPRLV